MSAVAAVFAVGIYAYQVGVSANQARTAQLEADLVRFQHDNLDLRDRMTSLGQQRRRRMRGAGEHAPTLCRGNPSGEAADLFGSPGSWPPASTVSGSPSDRGGRPRGQCQSAPVTKRFMPRTPISTGPPSSSASTTGSP